MMMGAEVRRMDFKEKGRGDWVQEHRQSLPKKNHEQRHGHIGPRKNVFLGLLVP